VTKDVDILITLVGLSVIAYGLFSIITMTLRVGFCGMHKTTLVGNTARFVGEGYLLGGLLITIPSLLSWLNLTSIPRQLFLIICGLGGTLVFVAHLAGTIAAESLHKP
jgi:hypothetical protein